MLSGAYSGSDLLTVMTTTEQPGADWPLVRLTLPADTDDEQAGLLSWAAVEAGASGTVIESGALAIYLPREFDAAALEALQQTLAQTAASLGWMPPTMRLEALADAPWATAWKVDFKTLPVGERLLIRPDWEQNDPAPAPWAGRLPIWLRPGLGFGTGRHETTRLALTLFEQAMTPGASVLDFGSGSGVLALAAVRLGAGRICAVEFDPQANVNAVENIELNGAEGRIELIEADTPAAAAGQFDLVLCNMLPQNALPRMGALAARCAEDPNARLIYTGYLADQLSEVEAALAQTALTPVSRHTEGEWGGVVAMRADQ